MTACLQRADGHHSTRRNPALDASSEDDGKHRYQLEGKCCAAMWRASGGLERRFGVPRELIMAIWTMESDNGTGDMGKLPVIRTLSTLAWDCRRSDLFQSEL